MQRQLGQALLCCSFHQETVAVTVPEFSREVKKICIWGGPKSTLLPTNWKCYKSCLHLNLPLLPIECLRKQVFDFRVWLSKQGRSNIRILFKYKLNCLYSRTHKSTQHSTCSNWSSCPRISVGREGRCDGSLNAKQLLHLRNVKTSSYTPRGFFDWFN